MPPKQDALFRGDDASGSEDGDSPAAAQLEEASDRHATDDVELSPPPAERVRDKAGGASALGSASDSDEEMADAEAAPKGKASTKTAAQEEEEAAKLADPNLLATLPIYLSASLPSTSRLALFQYPTYAKGAPLPVPESAKQRGLSESARWRPKADRVELELPLDLRTSVYNSERGSNMGKGVQHGGTIGGAEGESKVKKEGGVASSSRKGKEKEAPKRLEKTRLESSKVPHQTKYLVGVIRDGALHLTHLDSVQQLRPSMHYLDGLDAIDKAEKKRNATNAGDDEGGSGASDSESGAAPSSSSAKADTAAARRKGALQVSATMGAKSADGKDNIMQAQREAEAENWVELEWLNEESEESQKTLDAQLFASSKQPLVCTTKMREFL